MLTPRKITYAGARMGCLDVGSPSYQGAISRTEYKLTYTKLQLSPTASADESKSDVAGKQAVTLEGEAADSQDGSSAPYYDADGCKL